jgi:hypothetical protein
MECRVHRRLLFRNHLCRSHAAELLFGISQMLFEHGDDGFVAVGRGAGHGCLPIFIASANNGARIEQQRADGPVSAFGGEGQRGSSPGVPLVDVGVGSEEEADDTFVTGFGRVRERGSTTVVLDIDGRCHRYSLHTSGGLRLLVLLMQ